MDKLELLQKTSFGESVAEQEAQKLKDYFLKTEYWKRVREGSHDIVYGAKGAGKSALYTSLMNDTDSLFDEGILISLAENPSGNTAFANLKSAPPTSQTEFIRLWKLYFLVITVEVFKEYDINDEYSNRLKTILRDCDLIPAQNRLSSFLKSCVDFLKSFVNGREVSTTSEFDPQTGMYSGQKFSMTFGEPSKSDFDKGLIPIEHAYELLTQSLKFNKIKLWIIIDRLDVAFIESEELEVNALRALFKTYLDLAIYIEIKIKIFLRDDIWKKISDEGFKEASHITKFQQITWTKESLLNLIIRRLLDNEVIISEYVLNKAEILESFSKQEETFYKFFPKQIDVGAKKLTTLEWILSRTKDGKSVNTPREIIQLLNHAKSIEVKRLENGINDLPNEIIISRQAFKDASTLISQQRMEQTIYAEYPALKTYMEALRGGKAEHSIETLGIKWEISADETKKIIQKLNGIGFFEVIGITPNQKFKIPFIYRPYLEIVQGKASVDTPFTIIDDFDYEIE
jgi:hypothetical protein